MSVYENFDEQKQFACRVIADHARATAFAIADGILPGNQERNYVLRKIMRRAIYHGREHLELKEIFFDKVCDFVIEEMKDAYPELEIQREFIGKMVRLEEERFVATMTVGLKKMNELLSKSSTVNFRELARLYDTYGLPVDLIFVGLKTSTPKNGEEHWTFIEELGESSDEFHEVKYYKFDDSIEIEYGKNEVTGEGFENFTEHEPVEYSAQLISIDKDEFMEKIEEAHKELQQNSAIGKTKQAEKINPIYTALERTSVRSNFHGYEKTDVEEAKVIALIKNDQNVEELGEGDEGLIILDETPFYAESGGQVGDTGTLFNNNAQVKVFDTFAPIKEIVLHKSKIEKGAVKIGDTLTALVDVEKRDAIRRNHTATHLVHAALREVLGTHVKQAGSVVAPNYLRFDFTHYQPISAPELQEIEALVNREILKNESVNTDLMSIEDAMRTGAMALFGEKYGSKVRVLSVGGGAFSRELCGGTHVRATGDIGSFKITADEAVASGVRRIRAITGFDAFERFRDDERLIDRSLGALKTQRDNLPNAIEKLQEELKRARREVEDLKMKIATGAAGGSAASGDEARDIGGIKVIAKTVDGLDKGGMRHLSDTLLAKIKSGVVILARTEEDKVSFIVRVSDDLTAKVKAGEIVRNIAPLVGGRGGGKPDMAEGGGTDAGKLNEALEESYKVVAEMLG